MRPRSRCERARGRRNRERGDLRRSVGLTLGGIVLAAVVIFGLGVMEGSRVAERAAAIAAPPGTAPAGTPGLQQLAPVAPAAPVPADKLTFYDRLSGVAPPATVALPEGQPRAQGLAPAAQPEAQGTPARQAEPQPPPAAAPAAPAAPRKPAAPATAAAAKYDPATQIRMLSGKGRFTVQMAAVSERAAAAETAQIKRNGFEATTVIASVKGKVWYRIRVGRFPDKQAATQAAGIFRSAYGLNAIAAELRMPEAPTVEA